MKPKAAPPAAHDVVLSGPLSLSIQWGPRDVSLQNSGSFRDSSLLHDVHHVPVSGRPHALKTHAEDCEAARILNATNTRQANPSDGFVSRKKVSRSARREVRPEVGVRERSHFPCSRFGLPKNPRTANAQPPTRRGLMGVSRIKPPEFTITRRSSTRRARVLDRERRLWACVPLGGGDSGADARTTAAGRGGGLTDRHGPDRTRRPTHDRHNQ